MRVRWSRLLATALAGSVLLAAAADSAGAGGWRHGRFGHGGFHHGHHGHSSFVLGLSFLVPLYPYRRAYAYDPPPRVVCVDRPPVCRRFNGDATVDATGGRFFGTACLQADGRWHIVE